MREQNWDLGYVWGQGFGGSERKQGVQKPPELHIANWGLFSSPYDSVEDACDIRSPETQRRGPWLAAVISSLARPTGCVGFALNCMNFPFYLLFWNSFWDRVSLCSPSWQGACYVEQAHTWCPSEWGATSQMVVSHYVGARNQTWVLCKTNK